MIILIELLTSYEQGGDVIESIFINWRTVPVNKYSHFDFFSLKVKINITI